VSVSGTDIDALFDRGVVQDPFDYYAQLRDDDPVHEVVPGAFIVTRMDLIQAVVADTSVYSSTAPGFLHLGDQLRPGLRPILPGADSLDGAVPGIIATADPPDHERQRRVLAKHFTTTAIRAMEPGFRALVHGALERVRDDGRIEWMGDVAEPLPMVMVTRLLGLSDDDAPALKRLGYGMVERIGGFVPEPRMQELDVDGIADMAPLLNAYVQARGGSAVSGDGIIATIARVVDNAELDDVEALGILTVLVAAGGESTTSLLGTAVRIVAEHPEVQERLRSNSDLIPAFVEEALRYDPPFRGHYRVTTEDTVLDRTKIPAGSHVVLMWPAANRDEHVYDHADDVRLDRPNARYHVGFGWGIHLCIGAPLARLEARVALEELLGATRRVRLDADALTYHPSLLVRRLEALPLVLDRAV